MNLARVLKNARNAVVDRAFRHSKAAGHDAFLAELDRYRDGQLCFAIAFNTPWVISLLIDSWQRNVLDTGLAIVDNSSKPEARKAIEALCRARNVPYLGLPRNIEWNPNRSHGIALNWTFYNVIKAIRPAVFGFIDHDCFPLKPIRIAERMGTATVYGMRRESELPTEAWYVWPGYCFMRLDRVEELPLDFKHRTELGLDTGGRLLAGPLPKAWAG